jgi:hypothetical protein
MFNHLVSVRFCYSQVLHRKIFRLPNESKFKNNLESCPVKYRNTATVARGIFNGLLVIQRMTGVYFLDGNVNTCNDLSQICKFIEIQMNIFLNGCDIDG